MHANSRFSRNERCVCGSDRRELSVSYARGNNERSEFATTPLLLHREKRDLKTGRVKNTSRHHIASQCLEQTGMFFFLDEYHPDKYSWVLQGGRVGARKDDVCLK